MKNWLLLMLLCAPIVLAAQNVDSTAIRQVDSLIQVSRELTDKQDFDKAIEINADAEKIALEKLGRESAAYGNCCFNHGRVFYYKGDHNEAETWYLDSKAIREKVLGKEHPDYAASLNNLAIVYMYLDNYEKAEQLYIEATAIFEKVRGKQHPAYARNLNALAALYYKIGNYEKAEPLYIEAMDIIEKVLGKQDPSYSTSLNNLAVLYKDLGTYEKAEPLYLESKAIREKVFGKQHPNYAASLHNLANLYKEMGNFEKAEPLYLEAKDIREKVLGKEHPDYAASLDNLGSLYKRMGKYEKVEPLFLEAKAIREKVHGKEHPKYAASLFNLANLYKYMGNYEQAEPLYIEAKAIYEKVKGKEHPSYATILCSLADLYRLKGTYEKAEPLLIEAKDIQEKVLGKENPDYAASLDNLGILYSNMDAYEKAEPLFLEAKDIREKVLGKEHPSYAESLNNLAALYNEIGNYEKSEPLLIEAKDIFEMVLGKEHPSYAESLSNLANLYRKTGYFKKAEPFYLEENNINRQLVKRAATYSSENQMLQYLSMFKASQETLQSFSQQYLSPEINRENYNNALFFNGLVLENERQLARAISSADTATLALYEKWQSCRRSLAIQYALPIAERKKTAETEAEAEGYEKMLMRSLPAFRETQTIPQWQDVRDQLKPGEVAIEFVHYNVYNPEATDNVLYAALMLQSGWDAPKMIPLFEEKQLDSLLLTTGGRKADYVARIYAVADRGIIVVDKPSRSLHELIWQPLEKAMAGVNTVYFVPTGLLHRLNLAAVPINADSVLADRYHLVELGSTRSLVEGRKARQLVPAGAHSYHNQDAVIFGGIQYEMDSTAIFAANARLIHSDIARRGMEGGDNLDSTSRGGTWSYLKGTEKEINVLAPILTAAGFVTNTRKGFDATEESFKNIGALQGDEKGSPRVIHLATHGFFFPDPKDILKQSVAIDENETGFKTSDNPLIRSGLLMAGANYAWKTGKPIKKGMENGILTAYEISHLDLSNTELVVLSACETGLGDIAGNEGVFGLQRAFKIAGAKYLIMSLWQVPDFQTQELMTTFYTYWLKDKKSIPEAFRAAQQDMREKYRDPYFWAGFVLVE